MRPRERLILRRFAARPREGAGCIRRLPSGAFPSRSVSADGPCFCAVAADRSIDASASHAIAELACLVCGLDQTGDGVAADEFEAVRWYMEAAEAGEPSAQLALARCLANGTGVPQDEKQVMCGCGPSCGAALLALV